MNHLVVLILFSCKKIFHRPIIEFFANIRCIGHYNKIMIMFRLTIPELLAIVIDRYMRECVVDNDENRIVNRTESWGLVTYTTSWS